MVGQVTKFGPLTQFRNITRAGIDLTANFLYQVMCQGTILYTKTQHDIDKSIEFEIIEKPSSLF